MSSRSSASNNRAEFIYQRENNNRSSWEVSEAPSSDNLVVNLKLPDTSMDGQKNHLQCHHSVQEEEYEPSGYNLCQFHHRIVHRHSPRGSRNSNRYLAHSEPRFKQDHAVNSAYQFEEPEPISYRATSSPDRIPWSVVRDSLNQDTKCSFSSKNVEGAEINRKPLRTPRSVYTKQQNDGHLQGLRRNNNEGSCKHRSPNVENPHPYLTPTSTDSGPDAYEEKYKKHSETNTSPNVNQIYVHSPSSIVNKKNAFNEDATHEYSKIKTKESCLDPYTTTDFFILPVDDSIVQTIQNAPLKKSSTKTDAHPHNSRPQFEAQKLCTSCMSRKSSRRESLQHSFRGHEEAHPYSSSPQFEVQKSYTTCMNKKSSRKKSLQSSFREDEDDMKLPSSSNKPSMPSKTQSSMREESSSRIPDEYTIMWHSGNKSNITIGTREVPSERSVSCSFRQHSHLLKDPRQPPLVESSISKTTAFDDSVASTQSPQLMQEVPTREFILSRNDEHEHEFKDGSVTREDVKENDIQYIVQKSEPKLSSSIEKCPEEQLSFPNNNRKEKLEKKASKCPSAEVLQFPMARCLLGVSFDNAIIDFLRCFQIPGAAKACEVSKSMDSKVKLKVLKWLNEQYENLGQDCIEARKSYPTLAQGSLSPESLAERKKILDSLSRIVGIKKSTSSTRLEEKKMDIEPRSRSGTKAEELQGAVVQKTTPIIINNRRKPKTYQNYADDQHNDYDETAFDQFKKPPANVRSVAFSAKEISVKDVPIRKVEPVLSELDQVQARISVCYKREIVTPNDSVEIERSSGYHSEIPEHGSQYRTPKAGLEPKSENQAISKIPVTMSKVRSPSAYTYTFQNDRTTQPTLPKCSEYSKLSCENVALSGYAAGRYQQQTQVQQRLQRCSKSICRGNDALSRITERSSEMRSSDDYSGKAKSSAKFNDDLPCSRCRVSQEHRTSCRQLTPSPILRQYRPSSVNEETYEADENTESSSQMSESPRMVSKITSRQYNTSFTPEFLSEEAKTQYSKPQFRLSQKTVSVCESKRCSEKSTVVTSNDSRNMLQNTIVTRNSAVTPRRTGKESEVLNTETANCPLHTTQITNNNPLLSNSFQQSESPRSESKVSNFTEQAYQSSHFTSPNNLNRKPRTTCRDVLNRPKSESYGKAIPNQQVLSKPKVPFSINDENLQHSVAKTSVTSPMYYEDFKCEQQGVELVCTEENAENLSSSEASKNDTEDSQLESCSQSARSYEVDISSTQNTVVAVKYKSPNELNSETHISYSVTIEPQETGDSEEEAYNGQREDNTTSYEPQIQESQNSQHKLFLNPSATPTKETSGLMPNNIASPHYQDMTDDFPDDEDEQLRDSMYLNSEDELFPFKNSGNGLSSVSWNGSERDKLEEKASESLQMYDGLEPRPGNTQQHSLTSQSGYTIPKGDMPGDSANADEQTMQAIYVNSDEHISRQISCSQPSEGLRPYSLEKSTATEKEVEMIDESIQTYDDQQFSSNVKMEFKTLDAPQKNETNLNSSQTETLIRGVVSPKANQPTAFCCGLHHKEDNRCIHLDLCKCSRTECNVAQKLRVFHYNAITIPPGTKPSGSSKKTEDMSCFGGLCRVPHNRRRSCQIFKVCENHKRNVPNRVKWAVAKISIFDDNSKTYELMQAQPIKPIKCTSDLENVLIIAPENNK